MPEEPCAFFHDDDLVFDSRPELQECAKERAIVHGIQRDLDQEGRDGISRAAYIAGCCGIVLMTGRIRDTAADLRKAAEICRIAGMGDGVSAAGRSRRGTARESLNAGAPMARGYVRDFKRTQFVRVPRA